MFDRLAGSGPVYRVTAFAARIHAGRDPRLGIAHALGVAEQDMPTPRLGTVTPRDRERIGHLGQPLVAGMPRVDVQHVDAGRAAGGEPDQRPVVQPPQLADRRRVLRGILESVRRGGPFAGQTGKHRNAGSQSAGALDRRHGVSPGSRIRSPPDIPARRPQPPLPRIGRMPRGRSIR